MEAGDNQFPVRLAELGVRAGGRGLPAVDCLVAGDIVDCAACWLPMLEILQYGASALA